MTATATAVVRKFAPGALPAYAAAFEDPGGLLADAGIATPLRLAHFMAQVLNETGALTVAVENGNYSAKALGAMWDGGNWHRYFAGRDACLAMAATCRRDKGEVLFNLVYGNRMGNGPPASGDGWAYRGRGVLQTTGRAAYASFGKRCGVDFEQHPALVASAEHALKPALAEWGDKRVNDAADRNDIAAVTKLVNGGQIGIDARRAWFAKLWPFVIGAAPAQHTTEWRVQAALALRGYDTGNPDGDIGPRTGAAIDRYRGKAGLAAGTAIDQMLLRSLGIG